MISLLVVDDEPEILEITRIFLEKTGNYKVTCETCPKFALDMIQTGVFDAVVSDYEMPLLNGLDLLKSVRNSGNNIPFIIFTGKGREDVVIEALNCGADSYVQKGGDPKAQFAELSWRVYVSVEKKRAEKRLYEANEYNKCLIELHVDPLVTIDCGKIICDVNTSMEKITLCSREKLVGSHFCSLFTETEKISDALEKVMGGEKTDGLNLVLRQGNGQTVPVTLFAVYFSYGNKGSWIKPAGEGIFAELHYA
ncbi:DNA-binding response OmpR family regulator [Methanomicrobium sp. W14]|uniref:response regulator n=1 Tax=Methanomicrobium sp. W14 TaxID=2817839 RepID=UPI001AE191BE|nr:response regulator [Methanomicrobium sp. W14]MBP2133315.1 DNA-binding response OmpR family regulator [Methanomicrobium sp. W14]